MLLLYLLAPFPLIALKVIDTALPAHTGLGVTLVTCTLCCEKELVVKNKDKKTISKTKRFTFL